MIKVLIACCGRFHYSQYARFLDVERVDFALHLSTSRRWSPVRLGVDAWRVHNHFFKEYVMRLLMLGSGRVPSEGVRMVLHRVWERAVVRRLGQPDILHVMLHGTSRDLILEARKRGIYVLGEPVNCHPRFSQHQLEMYGAYSGGPTSGGDDRLGEILCEEAQLCDHLLVPSTIVQRSYIEQGCTVPSTVITWGVDPSMFKPSTDSVFRDSDTVVVLCVAQICPRKGQHILLRALEPLLRSGHVRLRLVGFWDRRYSDLLAGYEGLYTHIEHLPHNRLAIEYQAADIFVLSSIEDGFAYVVTEAMASGLPIVCTDAVGAADLVVSAKCGAVVPAGDSEALRSSLQLICSDAALRLQYGDAARGFVTGEASWLQYAERLAGFYERCLAP